MRRAKSGKTLVEARGDTDVQIVLYAWKKGGERQTAVSLRITGAQQIHQAKANDWRNREHVVLDTFSS